MVSYFHCNSIFHKMKFSTREQEYTLWIFWILVVLDTVQTSIKRDVSFRVIINLLAIWYNFFYKSSSKYMLLCFPQSAAKHCCPELDTFGLLSTEIYQSYKKQKFQDGRCKPKSLSSVIVSTALQSQNKKAPY